MDWKLNENEVKTAIMVVDEAYVLQQRYFTLIFEIIH